MDDKLVKFSKTFLKGNVKYVMGMANPKTHTKLYQVFFNEFYLGGKDDRILDFGAGSGKLIYVAKQLGYKNIMGLDIDQRITDFDSTLNKIHKLYDVEGNIVFYYGGKIPFFDNTFDSIISCSSIIQDNTLDNDRNLYESNITRLELRAKELVRISRSKAVWYISPDKDFDKFKLYFDKHNDKKIIRKRVKIL